MELERREKAYRKRRQPEFAIVPSRARFAPFSCRKPHQAPSSDAKLAQAGHDGVTCALPDFASPVLAMTDDKAPRSIPIYFSIIGLAAAGAVAIWAGHHYMTRDASLFYGLLAGLSFGAAFAFGQQIRNAIMPPPEKKTDWKVQAPAPAGEASPQTARQARRQARKITVACDDEEIRTLINGVKREGVAWQEVTDISIRITGEFLPQPHWIIGARTATAPKSVMVPNDAEGIDALMDAMRTRLPGYDNEQTYQTVATAMAAMEGSFPVWRRQADSAA